MYEKLENEYNFLRQKQYIFFPNSHIHSRAQKFKLKPQEMEKNTLIMIFNFVNFAENCIVET